MELISYTDIKNQTDILRIIFNTIDMNDELDNFYNKTPFYSKDSNDTYSKCDLITEETCYYGDKCLYKNNPLICPKNHYFLEQIIKKNTIIPKQLCRYERPWRKMKCINIYCWYSHLKGHIETIEKLKIEQNIII